MKGTWRCRYLCSGITGVCVAILGSVWWEYWGSAAVLGSRTVGVLRGHMAELGDPSNNSGGMQGHPLAP